MKLRDLFRQFSCSPTTRRGHRKDKYRSLSIYQNVRSLEQLEERVLLSSVNGIVFEDNSGDGVKEATDRQLSGFPGSAWNVGQDNLFGTADDQFVAATRTNAAGRYAFTLTTAANYAIRFGGQIGAWQFSTSPLNSPRSVTSTHLANLSPTYYQFPRLLHNALRRFLLPQCARWMA